MYMRVSFAIPAGQTQERQRFQRSAPRSKRVRAKLLTNLSIPQNPRKGKSAAMRFGEGGRFEAKILVDDKAVQEYVDVDDTTWVRRACACLMRAQAQLRHSCAQNRETTRLRVVEQHSHTHAPRHERRTRQLSRKRLVRPDKR